MENVILVRSLIVTLDSIEVRGKDNLDKLLGCINALECLESSLSTSTEEEVSHG